MDVCTRTYVCTRTFVRTCSMFMFIRRASIFCSFSCLYILYIRTYAAHASFGSSCLFMS